MTPARRESPSLDPLQMATIIYIYWASQEVLVVKNWPANAGNIRDVGSVAGLERSQGGGNGNPQRTKEPDRLQSMGSQRVGHN